MDDETTALLHTALREAGVALLVISQTNQVVAASVAAHHLLDWPVEALVGLGLDAVFAETHFLTAVDDPGPGTRRPSMARSASGALIPVEVEVCALGQKGRLLSLSPQHGGSLAQVGWPGEDDRLSHLAANLPGILFQCVRQKDGTLYYPFFSSGVRDILGYEPEDMRMTQDGCPDCIHWADRDDYLRALHASAETLQPFDQTLRVISRDGAIHWLSGTLRPERMVDGDTLWDAVLIDVTKQKRAEQRLEMIMNHAADCILTVTDDFKIASANAAVSQVFGYQEADLIGQDMSVLLGEADRDSYTQRVRGYLETGDPELLDNSPKELKGQDRNGQDFPIELTLSEVLSEGHRIFIAVIRDITQRKKAEYDLQEVQERLSNIARNIQGIVFQRVMTPDGRISFTYVSEGSSRILGHDPEELIRDGELFLDLMNAGDREEFLEAMRTSALSLEPMESDFKITAGKGKFRWLRSWSRPRLAEDGQLVWDGIALDVTDRKESEEQVRYLAYHDPLTGLGNRALFNERFDRACSFARKISCSVAVLSLGLDRFSIINATMGHSLGDKVLVSVARRLAEAIDPGDLVCRAGGDRFLILISGITTDDDILETVRSVQQKFETPITVNDMEFDLTVSAGAATYPRDGEDAESLVMNADAALQKAKQEGPSSYQLYTRDMGQSAVKTLNMQHRLRRALDNEEFVAYFQPQFETRSGRVIGMEALVRWLSPEDGMIPPGAFIDVAEEYGLIDVMCEQVLRDACRWNRRWQDEGLATVPVAVNISGRQFHNSRLLLNLVDSTLREFSLNPRYLELELTESSAMSDPDNAIHVVQMLVDRGVNCAIDDFGTGYSSLSVLKRFPIHKLKIDRSFVSDVTEDAGDAAIVCAMIAMSNALNLKVVAEGVENQEQLDFLHGVGCDQIQGFYMSRPLPGEQMEAFFRDKKPMPKPR